LIALIINAHVFVFATNSRQEANHSH
jgi:hypothetical protein